MRLTYLKVWKVDKTYGWCFWRPNDRIKRKHDAFIGQKQKTKVGFVYFEVKLEQDRCAWSIYNLKTTKW